MIINYYFEFIEKVEWKHILYKDWKTTKIKRIFFQKYKTQYLKFETEQDKLWTDENIRSSLKHSNTVLSRISSGTSRPKKI